VPGHRAIDGQAGPDSTDRDFTRAQARQRHHHKFRSTEARLIENGATLHHPVPLILARSVAKGPWTRPASRSAAGGTTSGGSDVFRLPVGAQAKDSVPGRINLAIRDFARRMDALLELWNSTADALAAEWDLRSDSGNGSGFEPTIR